MGWVCGTYGETRDVCTVLVGKPDGKRQLGKGLWRNNIKMNLKEIDLRVWTGLIWLRTETIDSLI